MQASFRVFDRVSKIPAGVFNDGDPDRITITDPTTFGEFWQLVTPSGSPPPPPVDFSASTVVAVSMGARGSTGYEIRVPNVFHDGSRLFVVVEEVTPGPRCVVGAMVTWPMTAIEIFAIGQNVTFIERQRVTDC